MIFMLELIDEMLGAAQDERSGTGLKINCLGEITSLIPVHEPNF